LPRDIFDEVQYIAPLSECKVSRIVSHRRTNIGKRRNINREIGIGLNQVLDDVYDIGTYTRFQCDVDVVVIPKFALVLGQWNLE
jgi:hypothetical protein